MIDKIIFNSLDVQGDLMESESGVTQRFIDELHSWDIPGD